jgi:hypothetical protein
MIEFDHPRLLDRDLRTIRAFRCMVANLEVGGASELLLLHHAADGSCCVHESAYTTVRQLLDALEPQFGKRFELADVEVSP